MQKQATLKFEEINKGFTTREAIAEAKRCLNCKNPSCIKGCPIELNISEYIHQLSMGNMGNALQIINEKSNLPAICGRVCPHEKQCEGNCILNNKGKAIAIGKLERFIADFDGDMSLIRERLVPKNRGKVAVIGSGPAGLTVAGDLARQGFNVVIYEKEEELGGVLMYGIPEYRLPKNILSREIKKIESIGVTFITNCIVGKHITVDEMFERGFDAVFIGTGTAIPKSLTIPGTESKGVLQSSYFLRTVSLYQNKSLGKEEVQVKEGDAVGIIGAGNVAIDAARTALRMGAKSVSVIYHRTEDKMSANKSEFHEAKEEGVEFLWETSVTEILGENGELKKIHTKSPDGEKRIPLNVLMMAIGSKPANRIVSTTLGIDVDEAGHIITRKRPYGMTSRKNIFAGGDVVHTPQTVVLAMKEAKKVAIGMAQYIDAKKLLSD
jgi:glutamate synthase (NADPH/NADH) small chain